MDTNSTNIQKTEGNQTNVPKPTDRSGLSIVVMLCCWFIAGLIALIYTVKADKLYWKAMDAEEDGVREHLLEKAFKKDKISKIWLWIGVGRLALAVVIVIIAMTVSFA